MQVSNQLKKYLLIAGVIILGVLEFVPVSLFTNSSFRFSSGPVNNPVIKSTGGIGPTEWNIDSLQEIEDCKMRRASDMGTGFYSQFPGFTRISKFDYCDPNTPFPRNTKEEDYFLVLPHYRVRADHDFYLDKNSYFIRKTIWDDTIGNFWQGHHELRPIDIRYQAPLLSASYAGGKSSGNLLIPVSKTGYALVKTASFIAIGAMVLYGLWFLWTLIRVVLSVINDRSFVSRTVGSINRLGWSVVVLAVLSFLIPFLLDQVYSARIPDELYIRLQDTMRFDILWIGLLILLVGTIVRKGRLLDDKLKIVDKELQVKQEELGEFT